MPAEPVRQALSGNWVPLAVGVLALLARPTEDVVSQIMPRLICINSKSTQVAFPQQRVFRRTIKTDRHNHQTAGRQSPFSYVELSDTSLREYVLESCKFFLFKMLLIVDKKLLIA